MARIRAIEIRPVLNGFVVTVGCQEVVFTRIEDLANEIIRYHKNPRAVEQEYLQNAVNPLEAAEIPSAIEAIPARS